MIRACISKDIEAVLDIWLSASLKAHDFIEPAFWKSQTGNMRHIYLPAAETHVYEKDSEVMGFYALNGDTLAALFVKPEFQGQGIGKQLLAHAKSRRNRLTLSVYKENEPACRFYQAQGFKVLREQPDAHTGHPEYVMETDTQA